ncbi:uncharacterized protein HMPREF1541_10080 [Cyphellophora europaea CBS 101466]|uniref:tRNA-splicing endonuclease subunit Sen54 N-terminal domain-containing protein n=1 Tax=Cyphellophora europaea (strain CBS 101466) TaxID=1220924 RepID=W2SAZ7_CYPE1|nr:uncharacterized protein HMPREF1541_10080 [Cyphellophora europaea CBS 101466]ETN45203.1 hypothetical protein HMPREF1541_10080 [Cyphellophora europaea CBS 101466]
MADADEDALPSSSRGPQSAGEGEEGDEEAQDFRYLASLTGGSKQLQGATLKRGVKDFEPNPTRSQADALGESRIAMYDALSVLRSQAAKNHNVGQFVDDRSCGRPWDLRLRASLRGEDWDSRCVVIYKFKSTFSRTIGRGDFRSWTWLLPEEALYLLERGSLDIRWPDVPSPDEAHTGEPELASSTANIDSEPEQASEAEPLGELPMSLQGAYATFVGRSGLTMDRYLVYTGLRRLGYVVQRASSWFDFNQTQSNDDSSDKLPLPATLATRPFTSPSLLSRLISFIVNPRIGTSCPSHGPLLAPGLYRNYNDVFRSFSLIPYGPPRLHKDRTEPGGPFSIAFHVWRPSSPYKKSAPPPVDFRICVLDARATNVPTMTDIGTLLDSMPSDELPTDKRAEAKIKHGKRSVILAVVDIGVVSYLRFNDASVGSYKIYEDKTARAQKGRARGGSAGGGGRGGGRGRGRGRGKGGR